MKRVLAFLITIMAIGMLTFALPVMAQDACEGQIGAGYGLCTAAGHLGCGTESEKNTDACEKIEDNFLKTTGEIPPWLEASCWTTSNDYTFQCASSLPCPEDCSLRISNPVGQTETCSCYNK